MKLIYTFCLCCLITFNGFSKKTKEEVFAFFSQFNEKKLPSPEELEKYRGYLDVGTDECYEYFDRKNEIYEKVCFVSAYNNLLFMKGSEMAYVSFLTIRSNTKKHIKNLTDALWDTLDGMFKDKFQIDEKKEQLCKKAVKYAEEHDNFLPEDFLEGNDEVEEYI